MRIVGLFGLFGILGPTHVVTKVLFGRSRWPRRFLAAAAWIVGVRSRVDGEPIGHHTLLVSNHMS
ncbi:MAG: 1-acyl-sn-glycerol-3-phosphate acyltransferase, partial [Sphingomonas sp.]